MSVVAVETLPTFEIPGKGFLIWSGHEWWAYAYYRDSPKEAAFIIGTKDLCKAIMLIEKEWE